MIILAGVVLWFACGVYGAGVYYYGSCRDFPELVEKDKRYDFYFCSILSSCGLIVAIMSILSVGSFKFKKFW